VYYAVDTSWHGPYILTRWTMDGSRVRKKEPLPALHVFLV